MLFSIEEPAYCDLTLEFLASFEHGIGYNVWDNPSIMCFLLRGREYHLSYTDLALLMGLYTPKYIVNEEYRNLISSPPLGGGKALDGEGWVTLGLCSGRTSLLLQLSSHLHYELFTRYWVALLLGEFMAWILSPSSSLNTSWAWSIELHTIYALSSLLPSIMRLPTPRGTQSSRDRTSPDWCGGWDFLVTCTTWQLLRGYNPISHSNLHSMGFYPPLHLSDATASPTVVPSSSVPAASTAPPTLTSHYCLSWLRWTLQHIADHCESPVTPSSYD